ncbi:MAG: hypothetical protein QOD99_2718 [Chthoniobacter sp.]|jgi:uncharacterized repeat protein (TIGR03943 family)|nr:hypothetical protein [Chthoniobacter sp.]
MSKVFSRWLPCVTLGTWSAILLYFVGTGRIASFLHPSFRPGVLLAGCFMLLLAAMFAFVPRVTSCCEAESCGHPLGRMTLGRVLTFLILLLPLGTAAMFSPTNFGAVTMRNRGVAMDASAMPGGASKQGREQAGAAEEYLAKTEDGNVKAAVIDLLYAAQDPSLRQDFENKTVELIGQFMPDNVSNASGNRFKLVRMFMTCCAADARPVAVLIEGDSKASGEEMSWIKVVGLVTFPVESGRPLAIVKARSVTQTDPPEETMLY